MTTNLDPYYQAIEIGRARLLEQAERGWIIEQTFVSQHGRMWPTAVRRRIGGLMIVVGQRVRGVPDAASPATDPQHAH